MREELILRLVVIVCRIFWLAVKDAHQKVSFANSIPDLGFTVLRMLSMNSGPQRTPHFTHVANSIYSTFFSVSVLFLGRQTKHLRQMSCSQVPNPIQLPDTVV